MTTLKGDDAALRPLPGLTVRMAERLGDPGEAGKENLLGLDFQRLTPDAYIQIIN